MRGMSCFAALAIASSIGSLEPRVRSVGASGDPTPRVERAWAGRAGVPDVSLASLRAAAGRRDQEGHAQHRLAVALRDLAARRAGTASDAAVQALLVEGVEVGEAAWARRPGSSSYATVLGDLHGQLASRSGGLARVRHGRRAAELYARAVQLDPQNPLAHVGIGISRLQTPVLFGGSVAHALDAFREAQRLDPHGAGAWIWEGIALRRRGDVRGARAALVHALTLDPSSRHARRELDALNQDFRN